MALVCTTWSSASCYTFVCYAGGLCFDSAERRREATRGATIKGPVDDAPSRGLTTATSELDLGGPKAYSREESVADALAWLAFLIGDFGRSGAPKFGGRARALAGSARVGPAFLHAVDYYYTGPCRARLDLCPTLRPSQCTDPSHPGGRLPSKHRVCLVTPGDVR